MKDNNVVTLNDWRPTTYQEIVNMAHKLDHKVTKQEAFEAVRRFMIFMQENRLNDIADSALARLYSYFRHTPLKKFQTPVHWVGQAAYAERDMCVANSMRFIWSDGETLWAMDGRRMHWIRAPRSYPEGFYDPKTLDPVECKLGDRHRKDVPD